jgi:hypothetical protein
MAKSKSQGNGEAPGTPEPETKAAEATATVNLTITNGDGALVEAASATTGTPPEIAGMATIVDPNLAPAETPVPSPAPGDPIKTVVDSAPVEGNGYVQPTSAAELSYAKELAARIAKSKESGFNKVKVAHADFVKMNAEGLIDFESRILIQSGQQLVIDDAPNCATGTYWNITE